MIPKSFWVVVLISFLALGVKHVLKVIQMQGYHLTTYNHKPGPCKVIEKTGNGAEDIQTASNGIAFITVGLYHGTERGIYKYDFNHPEKEVKKLKIERSVSKPFEEDLFIPHGLSLFEEKGEIYIYVVNHHPIGERVEKFKYDDKFETLLHYNTFTDPAFRSMNDIAITGKDSFYYTNWLTINGRLEIEMLFLYHGGDLQFYSGTTNYMIKDNLLLPNGIALSPNKKYLHVAHMGERKMLTYRIRSTTNLTLVQEWEVGTMLDNLDVDSEGRIWTAGHPILHKTSAHLKEDITKPAPSQVLVFNMKKNRVQDMWEVYSNDGTQISGSSVASFWKGQILIGSVSHKLVLCDVNVPLK